MCVQGDGYIICVWLQYDNSVSLYKHWRPCGLPVVTHPQTIACLAYCSDGLLVAVSSVCVGSLPLGDLPAVETGKIHVYSNESFNAELAHTVNHA